MSEHTSTPWHLGISGFTIFAQTHDPDANYCIGSIYEWDKKMKGLEENKANAEFIVRAVNCHDELVAACELVMRFFTVDDMMEACDVEDAVKAAIARTKPDA